jgi:hypothetical protein
MNKKTSTVPYPIAIKDISFDSDRKRHTYESTGFEIRAISADLLHYSAVTSNPKASAKMTLPLRFTASSCLRRAAALAGLGLELWG